MRASSWSELHEREGMPDVLTIELRRVAEGEVERSGPVPAAAAWTEGAFELVGVPAITFVAGSGASGEIRVQGELEADVRLTCRRCLAERRERVLVPLDFRLEPGLEAGAADEGVFPLEPVGDAVDVSSIVREELLLALPEYSECRPDCRGLCPRCGIDLNESACECGSAEPDPRWEKLRKLRA